MNQNSVKTIGINDEPRKDSHLVNVNQADGLKGILNRDFDEGSNFDVGKGFQFSNGFFLELWRFSEVRKLILNAIVADKLILFQIILRILKMKNVLVKKVLT